jgi:hypothetical protein
MSVNSCGPGPAPATATFSQNLVASHSYASLIVGRSGPAFNWSDRRSLTTCFALEHACGPATKSPLRVEGFPAPGGHSSRAVANASRGRFPAFPDSIGPVRQHIAHRRGRERRTALISVGQMLPGTAAIRVTTGGDQTVINR